MSLKDKGIILQEEKMTFREVSELWLTNEKVGSVTDQTITTIKSQLKTINAYIGDVKVKSLRRSHIEEFRAAMIESGTIKRYNDCLSRIRAIIVYAAHKNIIATDVTIGMKPVINSKRRKKRSLTPAERQIIEIADFNEFERCFINLLLYTGMRKSEALALNISDIDLKKKRINVSKTLVASKKVESCLQEYTKTVSGKRYIPIPSPLYHILEEYVSGRTGILFLSERGGYIGAHAAYARFQNILKKLQAVSESPLADDITAHTFRHTYASDLYKAGVDIKQAQYLLGHTDIKTTLDTYTHFGYTDVKIDKLEDYYNAVKMQSESKVITIKHA